MNATLAVTRNTIIKRSPLWLAITVGSGIGYYLFLMGSLIFRFGNLPNYVVPYDWFGNVAEIIRATPSVSDMIPIILDEWALEIGFMNRSFGNGISEWSLFLVPHKVLIVFLLGALVATNVVLLLEQRRTCSKSTTLHASATTGFGAALVALSSATMSWVVCCSTPTWVVGLAMMGLGVSTSLWLEPLGSWVMGLGFTALCLTAIGLARRLAAANAPAPGIGPIPRPA